VHAVATLTPAEPGIRGLLGYRPETGRPLSELAEVLLRGPGTLTRGERELIAAHVSALNECRYCSASHAAWPQQDFVDGQAAWTAEDERDDLGDVFGGDLGLVVELPDALSGAGVGDVIRQLGGHDTRLDERHADVRQQFLPQ
jgi:Carboxymuconolactone decarboxylase family